MLIININEHFLKIKVRLLVSHTDGAQPQAEVVCTPKAHFIVGIL